MPPAPARDHNQKSQPMSISHLCQQGGEQDLDHDPLDLNDPSQPPSSAPEHHHHSHSSDDEFEELEDSRFPTSTRNRSSASGQLDAAEQLAAEALGDMANGAGTQASEDSAAAPSAPFISRMSSLPLVTSALKAYETTKQNSNLVKYGAEMVESGVKSISKPVFDKLEPKLGQLDDFACRQLDKLEKVYPKSEAAAQALPSPTNSSRSSNDLMRPPEITPSGNTASYFAYRSRGDSIDSASSAHSSRASFDVLRSRGTRHEDVTLRKRSDSQSSQRSFQFSNGYYPQPQPQQQQPQQQQQQPSSQQHSQVASVSSAPSQQFSGWRGVVATVGTASAAGVAIFSEESMKSLKYCLQWLQYAVQHIDHQIGLLRQFLVSLANPSQNTALVPSTAASTLASIKKEVVETLRKVISVVSRYAGACLPDQAKIRVREFILSMPVRWATINNESLPSTPMGSPSLGPSDHSPEQQAAIHQTSERATKVLVLAHESSDMLKSVASIFKDSVDKAENWMDKLRYVGMNPQHNSEGLPSWAPTGFPGAPPGSMPGGFPGSSPVSSARGSGSSISSTGSTGLEQYSLRQTQHSSSNGMSYSNGHGLGSPSRSLKSSPRLSGRDNFGHHQHRHTYRQKNSMSGDEDSGSEDEDESSKLNLAMDDSDDELAGHPRSNGHGPLKRSMGSITHSQGNAVRRRKKRGESAEVVAGLGLSGAQSDQQQQAIKQEPL